MNKPFVHMLTTPLNKYAFDVNTNQLIQVGDKLYEYLLNLEKESDSEYAEPDSDIKKTDGNVVFSGISFMQSS